MKQSMHVTTIICIFLLIVLFAGEPDLLDSIQIRVLTADVAPFCQQMGSPVAGLE